MKILLLLSIIIITCFIFRLSEVEKLGYKGERIVRRKLKRLKKNKYKVINNLLLKTSNGSSQLDHIVISQYGIFIIETKNYKGIIRGNEYDDFWMQILSNRKNKLRNPIKQNNGHIKAIKDAIPSIKNVNITSLIVFTNKAKIQIDTKTIVVYPRKIKKIIKGYRHKEFSKEEVQSIYEKLCKLNIDSFIERKVHIKNIKRNVYKAEKKIKKNKCPRCGSKLKKKKSKYGKFKGCKNYPQCTFKMNL